VLQEQEEKKSSLLFSAGNELWRMDEFKTKKKNEM